MRIIGITGGVGAGKSYVAAILERDFQADIIFTDLVARELMRKGQDCYQKIIEAMGTAILMESGEIDRKKLSALIFEFPENRLMVNKIVHPAVKREVKRRIQNTGKDLVVIESALLLEDNYQAICDEMWYIYASEEVRIQRLMEERGYSRKQCENIMKNQMADADFRAACQAVIVNEDSRLSISGQIRKQLERNSKG